VSDLRAIASQHVDYVEINYSPRGQPSDWGPQFFCDHCELTLDGVWSDMDEMEWDEPHNAYRQMAEHWRAEHEEPG
jgi:hypothetical protein